MVWRTIDPLVLALLAGLAALSGVLGTYALMLVRQVRALSKDREERRSALAHTSKLLIDKNMELFDQNLKQQRELESKEDFIGILSHQLRTPATEVRWGLDALASEMAKHHRSGAELEYFNKLQQSAEHMVKLIDNLVRLMSLDQEAARHNPTAFEPDPVIRAIAEEIAKRFQNKHISLTLVLEAQGAISSITQGSLELVVENLVENAYDYTPEGGTVTVTTAKDAATFTCTISDTGVGIPKEKAATMFLKFQRSETAQRMNASGMGLGLYLVKNIVDRHAGTITFESTEGKGSTFRFVLPLRRVRADSLKVEAA